MLDLFSDRDTSVWEVFEFSASGCLLRWRIGLGRRGGVIFEHDQVGRDRSERLGGRRRLGLRWRDSQHAWTTQGWKPDHVARPEMPTGPISADERSRLRSADAARA